ncbi:phage holin family protein [uncultured Bifidobacterium sp.]|uniref:phage holin family protein n=1 Tax=uncultured Bifidobacterium sp. TaxID=165187 RepID=UPI0025936D72|nr:phage holin family protein [uncultured Bifidobacterium sp.]
MPIHELIVIGIVFLLVLIDYVTGVVNAVMHGELSSERMRQGLGHKFAYLAVICVALIVEYGSDYIDLGIELPVFIPVCVGICLIEITSIMENCVKINPELSGSNILNIFNIDRKENNDTEN